MEIRLKTRFQFRSIMDMTPLIDFAFSLLIFFIMSYNAGEGRLSSIMVNLPSAMQVGEFKRGIMVITVNNNNQVYIDDKMYGLAELPRELRERKSFRKDLSVVIRGDSKADYQTIVSVMDYLVNADIRKFTLTTVMRIH
jgi:biopolymer transport protein ExbD